MFICYIWLSGTITASCLVPLLLYVVKLVQITSCWLLNYYYLIIKMGRSNILIFSHFSGKNDVLLLCLLLWFCYCFCVWLQFLFPPSCDLIVIFQRSLEWMNKILLFLLNFSVKMLVISFETPKDLNSHFAKCRRAFFGITVVHLVKSIVLMGKWIWKFINSCYIDKNGKSQKILHSFLYKHNNYKYK